MTKRGWSFAASQFQNKNNEKLQMNFFERLIILCRLRINKQEPCFVTFIITKPKQWTLHFYVPRDFHVQTTDSPDAVLICGIPSSMDVPVVYCKELLFWIIIVIIINKSPKSSPFCSCHNILRPELMLLLQHSIPHNDIKTLWYRIKSRILYLLCYTNNNDRRTRKTRMLWSGLGTPIWGAPGHRTEIFTRSAIISLLQQPLILSM